LVLRYYIYNMPLINITLRPFSPTDSIEALTQLINAAYQPLAERGFRYLGSYQDAKKTAERIAQGECWVAEVDGVIVGTIRYRPPGPSSNPWYAQPGVASFGQFAVVAGYQKHGIGGKLLEAAEQLARRDGAHELACDTAEGATDLVAYYNKRGYRLVGYANWDITNYRSVLLSKTLTGH